METAGTIAPPVVAVMVVHQPGDWFDEVLDGLARQDYTNLKLLFLVVGDADDVPARIRDRVPHAFVRAVAGNPGFGAAANEVLRLVEGDNGFFCFLHDDVALEPGAIRLLVEELYRSNAGVVGPKLVTWDDPTRAAARRSRRRPLRRDRPDRRAGGVRPGAARRRARRVRRADGVPARARRPVPHRSVVSTRPSSTTATTSTCAGAPTSAAPA